MLLCRKNRLSRQPVPTWSYVFQHNKWIQLRLFKDSHRKELRT